MVNINPRDGVYQITFVFITSALVFVVALSWNDMVTSIFKQYLSERNTIVAKLVYSIILTIIAVFAIRFMNRFLNDK